MDAERLSSTSPLRQTIRSYKNTVRVLQGPLVTIVQAGGIISYL